MPNTNIFAITIDTTSALWSKGRYALERRCTHLKGQRYAECQKGWHTVATSDDRQDAIQAITTWAQYGQHRVVDTATGREVS